MLKHFLTRYIQNDFFYHTCLYIFSSSYEHKVFQYYRQDGFDSMSICLCTCIYVFALLPCVCIKMIFQTCLTLNNMKHSLSVFRILTDDMKISLRVSSVNLKNHIKDTGKRSILIFKQVLHTHTCGCVFCTHTCLMN